MARSTSSFRDMFNSHDDSSIARVSPPGILKKKAGLLTKMKKSSRHKFPRHMQVPTSESEDDAVVVLSGKKSIEINYDKYLEFEKYLQKDGKFSSAGDETLQETRDPPSDGPAVIAAPAKNQVQEPAGEVLKEVREAMEEKQVGFDLKNNRTKFVSWKNLKPSDSPDSLNLEVPPPVKYGWKTEYPVTEDCRDVLEYDELTDSESADSDSAKESAKLTAPPRRMAHRESSNPFKKAWSEVCEIAEDVRFMIME